MYHTLRHYVGSKRRTCHELSRVVALCAGGGAAGQGSEKMKKKGLRVQPVQLTGRTIAASFWGKGWCDHIDHDPEMLFTLRRTWDMTRI